MERKLTGRDVLFITVSAFGVIIAVNVTMAFKAISTFPGLEVKSSYVASQSFDADRRAQKALGWSFVHGYEDGRLRLAFMTADGKPAEVSEVKALVGRATQSADDMTPVFSRVGAAFEAPLTLGPGRWMVLMDAVAADGTRFHKRFDIAVRG